MDPRSQYMSLLEDDAGVTMNTPTVSGYDDFARRWRKKDPRFLAVKDDRDRKAFFKDYIAGLKQKEVVAKKEERKKIAQAFAELLREAGVHHRSLWKDVRPKIESDQRYQAVRSMIEREDMFRDYLKNLAPAEKSAEGIDAKELERRERREEEVRRQKRDLYRESHGKKNELIREEATLAFSNMLTDHIRIHTATYDESLPFMTKDARWADCERGLTNDERRALFAGHTARLHAAVLADFHALVEDVAFDPTTEFSAVAAFLRADPRGRRLLGLRRDDAWTTDTGIESAAAESAEIEQQRARLERAYADTQRGRRERMRAGLRDAVGENAFVAFSVKKAVQAAEVKAAEATDGGGGSGANGAAAGSVVVDDDVVWAN
ncbi:hypothetical protein HK405_007380, partial [Cladochytrium tenue]